VGGVSNVLGIVNSVVASEAARRDAKIANNASNNLNNNGENGLARLLRNKGIEDEITQISGYIDTVKNVLSAAFAFTGVGGLLATGIATGAGVAASILTGIIKHSMRKTELLYSPDILGGIDYNKNVVSDDMFQDIVAQTTGITTIDGLYDAIRIVDSIDLHRRVRMSTKLNYIDNNTDTAMGALGFTDREKYPNITLEDIQNKTGYKDNWKEGLIKAVQKRGIDYDTSWSTFVRGIRGITHYDMKEAERLLEEGVITKKEYLDIDARCNAHKA
jgi:hypothetical protein